jgi:hypothetical protein
MAWLGSTVEEALSHQGLSRLAVVHLAFLLLRWQGICIDAEGRRLFPRTHPIPPPHTGIASSTQHCNSNRKPGRLKHGRRNRRLRGVNGRWEGFLESQVSKSGAGVPIVRV